MFCPLPSPTIAGESDLNTLRTFPPSPLTGGLAPPTAHDGHAPLPTNNRPAPTSLE